MATKEITKRDSQYVEPELDRELISLPGEADQRTRNTVARLALLWEKRRFLSRAALIGLVASTLLAFLIPPRYTSTARLMPPDQAGQGMATMLAALGKSSELSSLGSELLGVKTSGDLFVGVLKSETVENAMIDKFDLRKVYGDRRWKDARDQLEDRTDVVADRKSGIITIKVTDRSPDRAAQMGREYVNQLNRVVISLDTSAAHRERVFLEERLKEVQQDLEAAEKDFGQFASKNVALDVKEQGKAMIGAAGELEGQLIAAETQLEGLRQIYTPNNVRVRSLQARIDEYQRQLQKMGGQTTTSKTSAPSQSQSGAVQPDTTDEGTGENPDLYPSIRQLPILGITWADLYRRTKVQEAVFETLTKQYEMAKVEEARELPSIKVLDVANVPEKKSFPPRMVIMLLGTCFALAMSSVWVLSYARWEEIDSSDPGKKLAQEVFDAVKAAVNGIVDRASRRFGRQKDGD